MDYLRLGGRALRTSRDFDEERASLLEGRDAALEFYQEQVDSVLADESLSNEEKRAWLMACRSGVEQTEREYRESVQSLNDEEVAWLADEYGVSEEDALEEAFSPTDEYGVSEDDALGEAFSPTDEYGVSEDDALGETTVEDERFSFGGKEGEGAYVEGSQTIGIEAEEAKEMGWGYE